MADPRLAVIRRQQFRLERMVGDQVEVHAAPDVALPSGCAVSLTRYPPRSRTPGHVNVGGEHHLVVSGRVQGSYEGGTFSFEPGDYFYWDGRSEHAVWNETDEEAVVVTVRTPVEP
jgi:quercetin dioxygenase-like cupin family protein